MNRSLKEQKFVYFRGRLTPSSRIIAIGGGKGGIGKSFFSSSLALFLSRMNYRTTLIDLDLGAANLHTSLGLQLTNKGLSELVDGQASEIQEIASTTPFSRLKMVSGFNDSFDIANLNDHSRSRLMSAIFRHQADYTILDLSAGTHPTTLDFFLMAQIPLVLITPDPSSIENAYRFMKSAFYRKIKRYEFELQLTTLMNELMTSRQKLGIRSPADLISLVSRRDKQKGDQLAKTMAQLQFQLVINQVRTQQERALGRSISKICSKYFGAPTHLLGTIDFDNAVWQAQRRRKHLLVEYPHTKTYVQLMKITRDIAGQHLEQAAV